MGGINEGMLHADKEDLLEEDVQQGQILEGDETQNIEEIEIPKQAQNIRQHISSGEVHLHDDQNKIKVAIPVADWYVILNKLKGISKCYFIDPNFNSVAHFRPFIAPDNTFDVAISLAKIKIGKRFKLMSELAKR